MVTNEYEFALSFVVEGGRGQDFPHFFSFQFFKTLNLLHAKASFHTMRYKGRESASGIGKKLSIIRRGATTVVAP
jgi:hypothetical protein